MDLNLISNEDLILELANRYDHFAFIGMKEMDVVKDPGQKCTNKQYTRRWKGENHMWMGLLHDLSGDIRETQLAIETPLKPEEM